MPDQLSDVRPIQILTIVDTHTREGHTSTPSANFRATLGVEALDQLVRLRDKPRSLRVDNGPEFAERLLDHWAHLNKVEIDFSRPGNLPDVRLCQGVQCATAGEVPERLVVPVPGQRTNQDREMAAAHQQGAAPLSSGQLDLQGLVQPS